MGVTRRLLVGILSFLSFTTLLNKLEYLSVIALGMERLAAYLRCLTIRLHLVLFLSDALCESVGRSECCHLRGRAASRYDHLRLSACVYSRVGFRVNTVLFFLLAAIWTLYGVAISSAPVLIPNVIGIASLNDSDNTCSLLGLLCASLQIVLCCIFPVRE